MPNLSQIVLTSEGYLQNITDWSTELAQTIAHSEGITLTEVHWAILHFVRNFYFTEGSSPGMRILTRELKRTYGPDCGSSIYLFSLFSDSPAKLIAKIAGLPKPKKCL